MLKGTAHCMLLLSICLPVQADLYRYVDGKGIVVLDSMVPPQYMEKGYEVLNEQGRVVKVVPPAPSLEERKRMQQEKSRAGSDIQLLRLYSSVADVDRARDRKLAELSGVIDVAKANVQSLRIQQNNLLSQAADMERSGREVPEHLLAQIDNLKAEQASAEQDILRFQKNQADAAASFAADRARLDYLLKRNQ
ncbi:DUF4124 domain-containing protein [Pseudomonas sp. LRF_L74]|uniref:DUF4124 domain-containing protein n=1 Tax=Pseudomonas sp. LRF_L74 TaxID=3369422 RepID=UPI003F63D836